MSKSPLLSRRVLTRFLLRGAGASIAGLAVSVVLVILLLSVGALAPDIHDRTGDVQALGLGVLPMLLVAVAAFAGITLGVVAVAAMARSELAGEPVSGLASWGVALAALPRITLLAPVGLVVLIVSIGAWPVVTLVLLLAALWSLRPGARDPARARTLALHAVPLAVTLRLLVGWLTAVTDVIGGHGVRRSVRAASTSSLRERGQVLGVFVLMGLTGAGSQVLGNAAAGRFQDPSQTSSSAGFAVGTLCLLAATVLWMVLVGALLGLVGHVAGRPPVDLGQATHAWRGVAAARWWTARRVRRSALTLTAALMIQAVFGLSTLMTAAAEPTSGEVVVIVTTLDDTGPGVPGECVDAASTSCGVRDALARATQVMGSSNAQKARVRFGVSGTVTLADTLVMAAGQVLDGSEQAVVLDAHQAVRAIRVDGEGGVAELDGVSVIGGRSDGPGAGLFSDGVNVMVLNSFFRGNVSSSDIGGGAVAVPYASVSIQASTFTQNQAIVGFGGAVLGSDVTFTNSTSVRDTGRPVDATAVTGSPYGGAVYATFRGEVRHATVVGGGGVGGGVAGSVRVLNSMIDPSAPNFACSNIDPSSGGNVAADTSCGGTATSPAPYGPLADNGGPTPTVALGATSPARDAGLSTACLATDQRGELRPEGACDAGAFEAAATDASSVTVTLSTPSQGEAVTLGSPTKLQAHLTSSSALPAGTVQVREGSTVLADNLPVDAQGNAATDLALAHGRHVLMARFVPTSSSVPPADSAVLVRLVQSPVTITFSTTGPALVHQPAEVVATITAAPPAGTTADPSIVPGGTVTFTSGSRSVERPVTGGRATWNSDSLPASRVGAAYSGDDAFAASNAYQNVTTADVATTTVATLANTTVEKGDVVSVLATVSDAGGAAGEVYGEVALVIDGTEVAPRHALQGSTATITLPDLALGTHQLLVRTFPQAGWAASTSDPVDFEVVPATTAITLQAPASSAYGYPVSVDVAATGHGRTDIRLVDVSGSSTTVLDTLHDVRLPWSGGLSSVLLGVGEHQLRADVVGSATVSPSSSNIVAHVVEPVVLTLTTSAAPARPGELSTVQVTTNGSTAMGVVTLTDATGTVLDTQPMAAGSASLSFTAHTVGEATLTLAFVPGPGSIYAPAGTIFKITIPRRATPLPTMTWSSDPHPGTAQLSVVFPDGAEGTPRVTGNVQLLGSGEHFASGTVVDGRVVLTLGAPSGFSGSCPCPEWVDLHGLQLVFAGDTEWAPATQVAPSVRLTPWPTSIVLDAPSSVRARSTLYLSARVTSGSPYGVQGSVIFTVGGVDRPAVSFNGTTARDSFTPTRDNYTTTVSARFVPSKAVVAPSRSTPSQVVIEAIDQPRISLSTRRDAQVGSPLTVYAVVDAQAADGDVRVGTQLHLSDPRTGRYLGSGTFESTGFQTTAQVTIVPDRGGPLPIRGTFTYGPHEATGSTLPFVVPVEAAPVPLVLSLDPAPDLAAPVVGQPVQLRATLALTVQRRGDRPLTLTFRDRAYDPIGTVVLAPNDTTAVFESVPLRTGSQVYYVSTEGDGVELGPARTGLQVDVVPAPVSLTLDSADVRRGVRYVPHLSVTPVRLSALLPAPDGFVTLTFTPDKPGPAVVVCRARLRSLVDECTLRTGVEGPFTSEVVYRVLATYDGDPVYSRAESQVATLRIGTVMTWINATFSPPISSWIVGTPVTATWQVDVPPGDTVAGSVRVDTDNEALCVAEASAGTCSFAVPDARVPLVKRPGTVLTTTYLPSEPAQLSSKDVDSGSPVKRCVTLSFRAVPVDPIPVLPDSPVVTGTSCSTPAVPDGFIEGEPVTIDYTKALEVPKLAAYGLAGATAYSYSPTAGRLTEDLPVRGAQAFMVLLDNTFVESRFDWRPSCVTVRATTEAEVTGLFRNYPEDSAPTLDQGKLTLLTQPNCEHPNRATEEELADLAHGRLRVAVGTEVEVSAFGGRGTYDGRGLTYSAQEVPGFQAPDQTHYYYRATITQDTEVYARYRVSPRFCTALQVTAGPGGGARIASAYRPTVPAYVFEKYDGSCVTDSGATGALPGTTLRLEAMPAVPFFVDSWIDDVGYDPATQLAPVAQGTLPSTDRYQVSSHDVTVPFAPQASYGVRFAHIVCSPVTVSVSGLPPGESADRTMTPSNCPARNDTEGTSDRVWYVPGTSVEVGVRPRVDRTFEKESVRNAYDFTSAALPRWEYTQRTLRLTPDITVRKAGQVVSRTTYTTGPAPSVFAPAGPELRSVYLNTSADASARVDVSYHSERCSAPSVNVVPDWYGSVTGNSAVCGRGEVDPQGPDGAYLLAEGENQQVKAIWTVDRGQLTLADVVNNRRDLRGAAVDHPENRVIYRRDVQLISQGRVRLDYCAPIPLQVEVVETDGTLMSPPRLVNPASIVFDGDDCPDNLYAHPGSTVGLGLRGLDGLGYQVVGWAQSGRDISANPQVTLDDEGRAPLTVLKVTPACSTLTAGNRVAVDTPANCPLRGASARSYTTGTPVLVHFDRSNSVEFGEWVGSDAVDGDHAALVMTANRTITANYQELNVGDQIVRVLSTLTQRLVAALLAAAVGFVMGSIAVVQVGLIAVRVVSGGLKMLGVRGKGLDVVEVIADSFDFGGQLSACTTAWATGGTGTALTAGSAGQAAGAGIAGAGSFAYGQTMLTEAQRDNPLQKSALVGIAFSTGNILAANTANYFVDPKKSWSSFTGIGSCLVDKQKENAAKLSG